FHFPTRKSKSLGEEFGEAVSLSSPRASNSTLGIGILSSAVSSLFCAQAKWERTKTRLMIRHFLGRKACRIAQPKGKTRAVANSRLHGGRCSPLNETKISHCCRGRALHSLHIHDSSFSL